MYLRIILLLTLIIPLYLNGQMEAVVKGTDRISSVETYDDQYSEIANMKLENIGPTIFSGRVTDVAVNPMDPTHFYVAYASGGLWETKNNGTTFQPIFDHELVMTIGDIAVNWTTGEIWAGTGEVNSSRSSYAGVGMYKSNDNGESWRYMGLPESHHIGRIVLHPSDPNTAWVAVLGHLYTDNPERGVYKTSDGGGTWSQTLAINDQTGVVDLIIDPGNENVLYAAAWQRDRKAWNFTESGEGSGIYKSTDGGESWNKISGGSSGFPDGEGTGRIGLAIASTDSGTRLFALLDNYNRRPPEEKTDDALTKEDFREMSRDDFLELDEKKIEKYLRSNRFPGKYKAKGVIEMVRNGKIKPNDLTIYLENANALLFDTPVIGAELYSSEDGGMTWTRTHDDYLDGLYYSYGYYFGVVSVNPVNADEVYIAGVPILRSDDGGKTFKNINGQNVHVDHHIIWVNPDNPRHIVNGNDGGINISYDKGEHWIKCNSPSVGQFYYINTDNAKSYNVYGGTQDNGVWMGSHNYRDGVRWHSMGQYPYRSILGGDGMQVQIDLRDNVTVYTGLQFGNYFRLNTKSGQRKRITPQHELGERPFRWNWQTPIHLSIHNPDILYMGGHKLFRSMDKGDNFEPISDDLTKGGKEGDVPYGTLATIHESPLRFGLIYTGSDDGLIYVSRDGGFSWSNISEELPQDLWVSRVQASLHEEGTVYASLNGYRNDDFTALVYKSNDYGAKWNRIGSYLPAEPVNVIKEDPHHPEILYVGTDRGVYISIDGGTSFMRTFEHIPNVPIHDIVIQEKEKDILIGTHGRSIYRGKLEGIYAMLSDEKLLVIDLPPVWYNANLGSRRASYLDYAENEQDIVIYSSQEGSATLKILAGDKGLEIASQSVELRKGLNYATYDLSLSADTVEDYKAQLKDEDADIKKADDGKLYLHPGKYHIQIDMGDNSASTELEIKKR